MPRPAGTALWRLVPVAVMGSVAASAAGAHGFGQRYDLPLPLALYLFGTAAAVVFSFVVAALFVRRSREPHDYPRIDLLRFRPGRLIVSPSVALTFQLASLGVFAVTVAAGLWGNPNPYQNLAPTLVWVIAWIGLAYVSAFAGNLWPVLNPWRTMFNGVAWLYRRVGAAQAPGLHLAYPERLGVWPAFALLLSFSWIELVYPGAAVPSRLAWLAIGYSILVWAGMVVFEGETWLRHGELFTVLFGVLARFAPTRTGVPDPGAEPQRREWVLHPFGAGLLEGGSASISMTAFVLLILSTVLYDGLLGTPEWNGLESRLASLIPGTGDTASMIVRSVGLVACWLLFFGAYVGVAAIIKAVVGGARQTLEIARDFAFTLVPIAIAYHMAHYLVFLLVQGQYLIPLVSDPFGLGWNLFGTAGYRVDIGIVDARFAWYTAVVAIVIGHVMAVFLAHARAMRVFETRAVALRSQVPLTALMVVYTFVSLSILAEPITEQRATAQPTMASAVTDLIPPDAVLPVPGDGRLQPVGVGKTARTKLTYRVLGSSFHDGTRMGIADILYSYAFAYRWSARSDAAAERYDPVVDAATAPLRQQLAGIRFVGNDTASKSFRVGDVNVVRDLFVIEVYTNKFLEDAEQDAVVAPPWSAVPWHVLALMEEAVSRGWAAFSQAEAARRGVDWLDLARNESLRKRLTSLVEAFEREGYRPDALKELVSVDEARKRWAALAAFHAAHGHFLVTNGPYQLERWSADSAALVAFRDLSYPLGVGSYDAYAIPRRAFITEVTHEGNRLRLFADVETISKFQRSYEIVREHLQAVAPDVLKRSVPECRYAVVDGEKRVVRAGVAAPAADATFLVDLGGLPPGQYTVTAEVTVNRNAANAVIRRIPVSVPGNP